MKVIKCKFCDAHFDEPDQYVSHLEKKHLDMIPKDMVPYQFYYFLKTGKDSGSCVMCKKPTTWNDKTRKYNRFCKSEACKKKYTDIFKSRMIGKYGKVTLLNDPEQQKKMLANRRISGVYRWSDGKDVSYTGSYELSFLQFLDEIMDFDSSDIMSPSPHTYYYIYEGQKHFYIPDVFIPSLNLEIEIKDGGTNPNMHHKIQDVDKVKEALKDEVLRTNTKNFNYLKIVDKNNKKIFDYLNIAKEQFALGIEKPIIMTESYSTYNNSDEIYTESIIDNDKYYRFTYNGIGVYEALKKSIDIDEWKKLITSSNFTWLPKPTKYPSSCYSYFTKKGRDEFIKKVLPICKRYLNGNIELTEIEALENIVYRDQYQVIVDTKA